MSPWGEKWNAKRPRYGVVAKRLSQPAFLMISGRHDDRSPPFARGGTRPRRLLPPAKVEGRQPQAL